MKNFWHEMPKPFFVLAPLANVTDAAFRRLIAKYSKTPFAGQSPGSARYVTYTEFVSADGLVLATPEGKAKLMRDLVFTEDERPIVAQFFTARPEMIERTAALAAELGFDGVDINMGCPDKTIEKQGAGAKLLLNPGLARELVLAAKRGAPNLPVSVKTRLGYNKDILDDWLQEILKAGPAVVTIHARTRKEMSKVPARWERVKRAVEIRNELESETLIVGNGDLKDIEDAQTKVAESGADGAMLGRAIFGKPWLFAEGQQKQVEKSIAERVGASIGIFQQKNIRGFRDFVFAGPRVPSTEMRLKTAVEHTKLFEELLGDIKSFALMKKHFKAYVEGFDGAKELRMKLMETSNAQDVEDLVEAFLK